MGACERNNECVLISISSSLQVYQYLFTDSHPIIRTRCLVTCPTKCSHAGQMENTKFPVQVLLTCRQIHEEGRLVMYHDNIWAVHGPAFTAHRLTNILMFNQHLFNMSRRHQSANNIRFLHFSIQLAPYLVRLLSSQEALSLRDADRLPVEIRSPADSRVTLSEEKECARYQTILNYLASVHRHNFPQLRSITILLNCHAQWVVWGELNCHQIKFLVHLQRQDTRPRLDSPRTQHIENADIEEIDILDDLDDIDDTRNIGPYEPRRQIFTPLALIDNLRNIEVQLQANPLQAKAIDTPSTEKESKAPKKKPPKKEPVRTFSTIKQMLEAAGVNFNKFRFS